MAATTRELKLVGSLNSELSSATILVNGVEVFNGLLGEGSTGPTPPGTQIDLAQFIYDGQEDLETITVSITVTSGSFSCGPLFVDGSTSVTDPIWVFPGLNPPVNDGRTNILIDGVAPAWPADGGPVVPGGTPEDPWWTNWCFNLSNGQVMTYDYTSVAQWTPTP